LAVLKKRNRLALRPARYEEDEADDANRYARHPFTPPPPPASYRIVRERGLLWRAKDLLFGDNASGTAQGQGEGGDLVCFGLHVQ
jgi:hypothetical protein